MPALSIPGANLVKIAGFTGNFKPNSKGCSACSGAKKAIEILGEFPSSLRKLAQKAAKYDSYAIARAESRTGPRNRQSPIWGIGVPRSGGRVEGARKLRLRSLQLAEPSRSGKKRAGESAPARLHWLASRGA